MLEVDKNQKQGIMKCKLIGDCKINKSSLRPWAGNSPTYNALITQLLLYFKHNLAISQTPVLLFFISPFFFKFQRQPCLHVNILLVLTPAMVPFCMRHGQRLAGTQVFLSFSFSPGAQVSPAGLQQGTQGLVAGEVVQAEDCWARTSQRSSQRYGHAS